MKKLFLNLKYNVKSTIKIIYMFCYQKLKGIDNKKIVLTSFYGKQYSDSGRAISEELHRRNKNLKIVWLLTKDAMKDDYKIIPNYVIKKEFNFLNFCKEIATAKVYITNENIERIYKNNKQMFIDTWHGDRGFKKILHEAYTDGNRPIPVYDDIVTDYCIAASNYGVERYRKAFKYNGTILNEGMPRNDQLVNCNMDVQIIKNKLGLNDEKLLLYAPTFRDNNKNIQTTNINFNKILTKLSNDGNKWKLIIRSHPSSKGLDIIVDEENVIDLSDYPDMTDILLISDFLITDYSSSANDFYLTNKPILLFLYDYEEYKKSCRDFCADPKEVGFIYASTEEELLELIETITEDEYRKSYKKVKQYYNTNETGNSTKVISDIIIDFIKKQ